MCVPVLIAIAVVGALAGAKAKQDEAKVAKGAAAYQEGVAANNQIISERAAADSIARGKVAEQQKRAETGMIEGKQLAGFAASGTDLSSGSVTDVVGDTAAFGELDALTIRSNYAREAYQNKVQASNFGAQNLLLNYQRQSINPSNAFATSLITSSGQYAQSGLGASGGGGSTPKGATSAPPASGYTNRGIM